MRDSSPQQKAYKVVFAYLAQQIVDRTLNIGSCLPPEREISERLNVSRNSTREAIRMLEMMGFVECRQGSGNYICCEPNTYMVKALQMMTVLCHTPYVDLLRTRLVLEGALLEQAVSHITPQQLESLHLLLIQLDHISSPEEFARLDARFHHVLISASQNEFMLFLNQLMDGLTDLMFFSEQCAPFQDAERVQALQATHWEFYRGLCTHNQEQIQRAADRHYQIMQSYCQTLDPALN